MQASYSGYPSPSCFYQAPAAQMRPVWIPAPQKTTQANPFNQPSSVLSTESNQKNNNTGAASGKKRIEFSLKAIVLIIPAILLAKFMPSKATSHLLPSDWKVWAKMILGVASLNQFNKAIQFNPPPWLGAMMNVLVVTPLISGKQGLRLLPVLLPTVSALVQGTQVLSQKAEKPLQDQFNIPPLATRLIFSAISMGVGIGTLPRLLGLFKGTWVMPAAQKEATTASVVATTCSRGCCSSTICINEIADCGAALTGWFQGQFKGRKH